MDELNAVSSSTEPTAEELASIAMGTNAQEAGGAVVGEIGASDAKTSFPDGHGGPTSATNVFAIGNGLPSNGGDAPAIMQEGTASADSINLGAHLSRLDEMLAEIERKIGAGIHLFAHEVTAARDHLAKLL
ncbi:hypothetical protein [Burkholderia cenocepacia]|uniref:hypothetical protein n=1 Tax=Burkholderia cenocepacia TaxID=95486 RepID=UPI0028BCAF3E|nr:hypothetical protein [Burkholderia cenocepacia]MDT6993208.1 hypothetical protein [Burkholderia cenocepacia]